MENGASIRINRETGEIQISGSEKFVNDHIGLVQSVLNISTPAAAAPAAQPAKVEAAPAAPAAPAPAPVVKAAAKTAPAATEAPKKGRGRPKKVVTETVAAAPAPVKEVAEVKAAPAAAAPAKRRGRPAKVATATTVEATPAAETSAAEAVSSKAPKIPSSFSAYMKSFKRKMKKGDWVLAAGYYFITSTNSDSFSTFNTSKLLKSQGIDLANPSQYMKNNISSGRIEPIGKRNYKVTLEGQKHLNLLATKK